MALLDQRLLRRQKADKEGREMIIRCVRNNFVNCSNQVSFFTSKEMCLRICYNITTESNVLVNIKS